MKRMRFLTLIWVVMMMLLLSVGCYMVSGQKMRNVQGTYELTSYTRTHGKTNAVTNYLTEDGYKAFLVVTGTGEGYYVYTDVDTAPTYRKVSLSYE